MKTNKKRPEPILNHPLDTVKVSRLVFKKETITKPNGTKTTRQVPEIVKLDTGISIFDDSEYRKTLSLSTTNIFVKDDEKTIFNQGGSLIRYGNYLKRLAKFVKRRKLKAKRAKISKISRMFNLLRNK